MKKWVFVTDEYPNVACRRRTRLGAWWHGATGHMYNGRVMRTSKFIEDRAARVEYGAGFTFSNHG